MSMKRKYLFTIQNLNLLLAKRRLNACPGLYMFYGESGAGKTTFLRDVFADKDAIWISSEKMKQMIVDDILRKTPMTVGKHKYVVIDNIEDINGEALLRVFSDILDGWADDGIVVAMTYCSNVGRKLPVRNKLKEFKVTSVPVSTRVVRRYASLIGKEIASDTAEEIAKPCTGMNSVPGMILRYSEEKT